MKQKIMIIGFVILGLATLAFFLVTKQKGATTDFHDKNLQMFDTGKQGEDSLFINKTYHYSIEYPKNWDFYINDKSRVTFGDPTIDMPSPTFSVIVEKTTLNNLSELDYRSDYVRYESDTIIDNQPAVIAHQGSDIEEFINEKVVYVLKGGLLYKINTDHVDHEAVWKSFKFID